MTDVRTPYDARVDGELDPNLSRWMWLVKWILAIPHYIVLLFLWIGFVVVTVIAFFAILITGRYPRPLFEYAVGVMRWNWRVGFYASNPLATDRYPPFTLADVPGYPARFDVVYPERLSRGLVLVKWWLLALPHYLLVAAFTTGAWLAVREGDRAAQQFSGPGLLGLLVLFAAIALLFAGRYPPGIFDLAMGLNRWSLRVAAYAALLTDQYPPFRLDQGPHEPGEAPALVTATRG
jgi:hypothetical protein